jgi:FemAB-related protein (PEP-CTERM system-associated)
MFAGCDEVRVAEASDDARWDDYVIRHPQASLFHLSGWRRVLDATFGYRPISLIASRDGRATGILPLFVTPTLPFGCSLISVPLGVYGGICADDDAAGRALLDAAQTEAERMRVRYVELRHETPVHDLPMKDLYVTFRKEIFPDPEKNLAAVPRKQRRMIRQGGEHGLVAQAGGEEWLEGFYRIYAHSVRNLGTPVYPFRLFQHLLREFGSACRIFVVHHEQTMVAAVMTFYFKNHVMPYYGGALRDAFQYAANDFMYWSLLNDGALRGYTIFDFGRSKRDSGSFHFKRHWGFEPTPLAYQYHLVGQRRLPDLSPRNPRFSPAIAVWKRLPLWLANSIGPTVVRFFP